ncbi:MAG TPA: lipoyl synthase, partial [Phycisphaerae bacterium]|nr:lipoyl synthase [Phycisphaerae bacterium]
MREDAMRELVHIDLGRAAYRPTLELQQRLVERVRQAGDGRGYLLFVEHDPPVITLGRRAKAEHVLASREQLDTTGTELVACGRGGDVTWHGPGQLVAYPIVRLDPRRRTVHGYVRGLEEAIIRTLARFGIGAGRHGEHTGVWVGREKVAAIGVAVHRWVAYHGLALNVAAEMPGFEAIVPCGLRDAGVTSLSRLLGRAASVEEVKPVLRECLREAMGFDVVSAGRAPGAQGGPRLPRWLRRRAPTGRHAEAVRGLIEELGLATVCSSARCPNRAECFARRTATFLVLGDRCTRRCRFCAVPDGPPRPVRQDEPEAVAEACVRLGLRHTVITSVTRDDLPDGGAGHFARVVRAVRRRLPEAVIEVLTPDFRGDEAAVATVLAAGCDVFNHNVETVRRLYPAVRPEADYDRSLSVLAAARGLAGPPAGCRVRTKSGLMVGLGETRAELRAAFADLRRAGCELLTVGQYLAPSPAHHPVARFVPPEEFAEITAEA